MAVSVSDASLYVPADKKQNNSAEFGFWHLLVILGTCCLHFLQHDTMQVRRAALAVLRHPSVRHARGFGRNE